MNIRPIKIILISALILSGVSNANDLEDTQIQPKKITFNLTDHNGTLISYTTSLTLSVPSVFNHELIETRPLSSSVVVGSDGESVTKLNYTSIPTEEFKGVVTLYDDGEIDLSLNITLLDSVRSASDGVELPSYRTISYNQLFTAGEHGELTRFSTFRASNDGRFSDGYENGSSDDYVLSYKIN